MKSCFYDCSVFHRRLRPREHEFLYRVFYCYLDLDELESVGKTLRIFGINRSSVYSFFDADHLPLGQPTAKENLFVWLRGEGFDPSSIARVRLLAFPRVFGYVFNPIAIFFCFDANERPVVSVIQVGNTFGEQKPFLVPVAEKGFHARLPKFYYVSPFSNLDVAFDFRFEVPAGQLQVWIDDYDAEGKLLVSTLSGRRQEMHFSRLLWYTLKFPLLTLRVIFLIHWHALQLWIKRVPFIRKEDHPELQKGRVRL